MLSPFKFWYEIEISGFNEVLNRFGGQINLGECQKMEKEIKFGRGIKKSRLERSYISIRRDQRLGEILEFEITQRLKCLSGPKISTVVSLQRYVSSSDEFKRGKKVKSKPPYHTPEITC
jgi:hypothetical protein